MRGSSSATAATRTRYAGFGRVKAVPSGDTVVLVGPSVGPGKPLREKMLVLSGVEAPRMGSRDKPEEPWAWSSREFLRGKLIGTDVKFSVVHTSEAGVSFGTVHVDGVDVAREMVAKGWLRVKNSRGDDELLALQSQAKEAGIGVWAPGGSRSVTEVKDIPGFVAEHQHTLMDAMVERVLDGSTLRVECFGQSGMIGMLVHIAGVQCPRMSLTERRELEKWNRALQKNPAAVYGASPSPGATDALEFSELRLLNRRVQLNFVRHDKSNNLFVEVVMPEGDVAVHLLSNGLGKLLDWSAGSNVETLASAEAHAKQNSLGIWKGVSPAAPASAPQQQQSFLAKVTQVYSGEMLGLVDSSGYALKVSLSSIKAPRPANGYSLLEDEPLAFEAREFHRKQVLGKKVAVTIEYVRQDKGKPDRIFASVLENDRNLAVSLLEAGLGSVVHHRMDDDRSEHYDALLAAEQAAMKRSVGLHSSTAPVTRQVVDLTNRARRGRDHDSAHLIATKATELLPALKRKKKLFGVVEYVFSGNRLKVFFPSEQLMASIYVSGVRCPNTSRGDVEGEPFGDEALQFTRTRLLQQDVQVVMEGVDRSGNFIASVLQRKHNLGLALLTAGLAKIQGWSADLSEHRDALFDAHTQAKEARIGVWEDYVEYVPEPEIAQEDMDATASQKTLQINVTEIPAANTFYFQEQNAVETLGMITSELAGMDDQPSTEYVERGGYYAGCFSDGLYYRVKVTNFDDEIADVVFVDYGNTDSIPVEQLKDLPESIASLASLGKKGVLSCLKTRSMFSQDALDEFGGLVWGRPVAAEVDFYDRDTSTYHLTLTAEGNKSVNQTLLGLGLARVSSKAPRELKDVKRALMEEQAAAKKKHVGIWVYGDVSSEEEG